MATSKSPDSTTEWCYSCDTETHHAVRVELWAENPDGENAVFSREPYRIRTCEACGAQCARRMNDGNSKP